VSETLCPVRALDMQAVQAQHAILGTHQRELLVERSVPEGRGSHGLTTCSRSQLGIHLDQHDGGGLCDLRVLKQRLLEGAQGGDRNPQRHPRERSRYKLFKMVPAPPVEIRLLDQCGDVTAAEGGIEAGDDLRKLIDGELATAIDVDELKDLPQIGPDVQI